MHENDCDTFDVHDLDHDNDTDNDRENDDDDDDDDYQHARIYSLTTVQICSGEPAGSAAALKASLQSVCKHPHVQPNSLSQFLCVHRNPGSVNYISECVKMLKLHAVVRDAVGGL